MNPTAIWLPVGFVAAAMMACSPLPKFASEPAPFEQAVLFDCRDAQGSMQLVAAPDGGLKLELQTAGEQRQFFGPLWSEIRFGSVVGQGGGHQTHVRLRSDAGEFIMLEGANGQLSDTPGHTYAGALQYIGNGVGEPTIYINCRATADNAAVQSKVAEHLERSGLPRPADEDVDGPYDGWF